MQHIAGNTETYQSNPSTDLEDQFTSAGGQNYLEAVSTGFILRKGSGFSTQEIDELGTRSDRIPVGQNGQNGFVSSPVLSSIIRETVAPDPHWNSGGDPNFEVIKHHLTLKLERMVLIRRTNISS